jgi:hypothetical protein
MRMVVGQAIPGAVLCAIAAVLLLFVRILGFLSLSPCISDPGATGIRFLPDMGEGLLLVRHLGRTGGALWRLWTYRDEHSCRIYL